MGFPFQNFLAANRKANLIPFSYFSPGDSISWIASDNSAVIPYKTTTITASPMTITASVHGQGNLAFGKSFDSSGNEILGQWQRNLVGDLTLTYIVAPSQINIYP